MGIIVPERLMQCIADDGRSVKAQAELIGINRRTIYEVLRRRSVSSANLIAIASFYGASLDWLCGMDLR